MMVKTKICVTNYYKRILRDILMPWTAQHLSEQGFSVLTGFSIFGLDEHRLVWSVVF